MLPLLFCTSLKKLPKVFVKDFFTSSQSPSLAGSIQKSSLAKSSSFLVPMSTLRFPVSSVVPSDITTCLCLPSIAPSCPSQVTIGENSCSVLMRVLNLSRSAGSSLLIKDVAPGVCPIDPKIIGWDLSSAK